MIVFDLKCTNGHVFETWFRESADFDEQREAGVITCPVCADTAVSKAPMAPRISTGRGEPGSAEEARRITAEQRERDGEGRTAHGSSQNQTVTPGGGPPQSHMPQSHMPQAHMMEAYVQGLKQVVDSMRAHVEENFDYVGRSFPEEARKIHYGEAESRPIYGEASPEESEELQEEGVEVVALPFPARFDS